MKETSDPELNLKKIAGCHFQIHVNTRQKKLSFSGWIYKRIRKKSVCIGFVDGFNDLGHDTQKSKVVQDDEFLILFFFETHCAL